MEEYHLFYSYFIPFLAGSQRKFPTQSSGTDEILNHIQITHSITDFLKGDLITLAIFQHHREVVKQTFVDKEKLVNILHHRNPLLPESVNHPDNRVVILAGLLSTNASASCRIQAV